MPNSIPPAMIVGPRGEPITGDANYQLAAAAPDLYDALEVIVRVGRLGIDALDMNKAERALAKARGENA